MAVLGTVASLGGTEQGTADLRHLKASAAGDVTTGSLQGKGGALARPAAAQLAQATAPEPETSGEAAEPAHAGPYVWRASRDDKRVKIKGFVPSEEDRKTIHGMIKANMPDLDIDDRTEVADGAPDKQTWLGAVSFALVQLSQMKMGIAHIENTAFEFQGEARTAAAYAAIKAAITTQLPKGVRLEDLSLTPPVAKPFLWTAHFEAGSLTLAGNVPSDESRARLLEHAAEQFGQVQIVDRMELAAGAPDNWISVVASTLRQLGRLEAGKASLTDTALAIEGVAETKSIAAEVSAALKQSLPKSYDAKDSIRYRLSGPIDRPDGAARKPSERT